MDLIRGPPARGVSVLRLTVLTSAPKHWPTSCWVYACCAPKCRLIIVLQVDGIKRCARFSETPFSSHVHWTSKGFHTNFHTESLFAFHLPPPTPSF